MRRFLSKLLVAAVVLTCFGMPAIAQQDDTQHRTTYEERLARRQQRFLKLMPTHTRLQFYGDMGLVSAGIGWDYGRKGRWETDILIGLIPKYNAQHAHLTLTLKQGYIPWDIRLGQSDFTVNPLTCGIYLHTILSDDDFWVRQPQRYPKGYYWFSTRVQTYIYLGQSINFEIPDRKRRNLKRISAFYEVGTNNAYILSAVGNHYLSILDILRLSFGLKFCIQ